MKEPRNTPISYTSNRSKTPIMEIANLDKIDITISALIEIRTRYPLTSHQDNVMLDTINLIKGIRDTMYSNMVAPEITLRAKESI